VAPGLQDGVGATPGDTPFREVAAGLLPPPLAPPGRLPLPAGEPPPVPVCPDGCPVSIVELTWTIACRNGGTTSATLAMNATPASTAAGRSQARPVGMPSFRAGARCRGGGLLARPRGRIRNRGSGRELGLGTASGHTQ